MDARISYIDRTQKTVKSASNRLWADCVPKYWKPYVELTRIDLFAGSLLLFWPCAWSLTIAATHIKLPFSNYVAQLCIFLLWSTIAHSVGSTWNDICDRDYDRLVERTKDRPLAARTITVTAACIWLSPQVLTLILLLRPFNSLVFYLNIFDIFFLNILYPFMKRVTYWPQAWLGICFNSGIVLAWVANIPDADWAFLIPFLAAGWCWTIHYDTCYAMMDKRDDARVGIKSTALIFGDNARSILTLFAAGTVFGFTYIGVLSHQRFPFFILTVLGSALHFAWQISTIDFNDNSSCFARFLSNGTQFGGIVWSGMFVNYILSLQ